MKDELETLVLRIQQGDSEAFDKLYEQTAKMVYVYALRLLKDKALAEDAMQDTYLRLLNSIDGYRAEGNALAYLMRICRNVSYNVTRKRRDESVIGAEDSGSLYGTTENPETQIVAEDNVLRLLDLLTEDEQFVLTARVFGGYRHREIAVALEKPIGTVLWLYRRAKDKISKELRRTSDACENGGAKTPQPKE